MTRLCVLNFPKIVTTGTILRSAENAQKITAVRSLEAVSSSFSRSVSFLRPRHTFWWNIFLPNSKPERLARTSHRCLLHLHHRDASFNQNYNIPTNQILQRFFHSKSSLTENQKDIASPSGNITSPPPEEEKKPSLWKRFKQMYREYWYVLVPVHIATSIVWFGGFYYLARSGVDIIPLLENLGASEKILGPLKESKAGAEAGYVAIAYAMYKIATPARYAVTVGGTTLSIGYLKQWGVIKPAPGPQELQNMIRVKRTEIQERIKQKKAAKQRKKQLRKRMKNNKENK